MPATNRSAPAVRSVRRGSIPTICGHLEGTDELSVRTPHIQVRTLLPGGVVIRVRAKIGAQIIWGHVESVVNQTKSSPSLVLSRRTTFGTCRTECIVGMGVRILKGFEPLSLDEIRSGDFVIIL